MQVGAAPPVPVPGPAPAHRSRRRPLLVVGAVVVVVAATAVAIDGFERPPTVVDATGRSLPHRPATAPVERWRVPVDPSELPLAGTTMPPVVVQVSDAAVPTRLRGWDPTDREVAWTRDLATGEVVVLVGDGGSPRSEAPVAGAGPPTVVVGIDVVDGTQRWRREVDAVDRGEPQGMVVDTSPGPAVQRWLDRVVVNVDGGCLVLDGQTGSTIEDVADRTCEVGRSDERLHTTDGSSWELRDRDLDVTATLAVDGQVRMVGDRWIRVGDQSVLSAWDVAGDPAWSQDLEWEVHGVDAFADGSLLVSGMSGGRLASKEDPLPGYEQAVVGPDGRVRSVPTELVDAWARDGPLVQVVGGVPTLLATPIVEQVVQTWGIADQSGSPVLARTGSRNVARPSRPHPTVEGPLVASQDPDHPELLAMDWDLGQAWSVALDDDVVGARIVASDDEWVIIQSETTSGGWWAGLSVDGAPDGGG